MQLVKNLKLIANIQPSLLFLPTRYVCIVYSLSFSVPLKNQHDPINWKHTHDTGLELLYRKFVISKHNLPSSRHTGFSLGFQLREPLECLTHSFLGGPLSLYPSWQWNRTTELSKKTPAPCTLYPCSGNPGSAQARRTSKPTMKTFFKIKELC